VLHVSPDDIFRTKSALVKLFVHFFVIFVVIAGERGVEGSYFVPKDPHQINRTFYHGCTISESCKVIVGPVNPLTIYVKRTYSFRQPYFQDYQKWFRFDWNYKNRKTFVVWLIVLSTKIATACFQIFRAAWVSCTNATGCRRSPGSARAAVSNTRQSWFRNLFYHFILRSDHILTMQTTKNQNMAGTKIQTSKVWKLTIFPDLDWFSGETGSNSWEECLQNSGTC